MTDNVTFNKTRWAYARALIKIDLAKELTYEMHITLPGGISYVQYVVYEQKKVENRSKSDVVPVADDGVDERDNGSGGIKCTSENDACLNLIKPHHSLGGGNTGFELGGGSEMNIDVVVQNRYDILKENNGDVCLVPDKHHKSITPSQTRSVLVDSNSRIDYRLPKSGGKGDTLVGKPCLKPGEIIDPGESKDPGRGDQGKLVHLKNASSLHKKRFTALGRSRGRGGGHLSFS
ncbi:hypothetical protein Dimus_033860 [Dionaea muscipula]